MEFIEELKNSEYLEQVFPKDNTVLLLLVGSRGLGVADENSDYNLVAVVKDKSIANYSHALKYKGKRVNWYNIDRTDLIRGIQNPYGKNIRTLLDLGQISDECIIFCSEEIGTFIEKRADISTKAMIAFCRCLEKEIKEMCALWEIPGSYRNRRLYRLCLISSFLNKEALDNDKLCQVKNINFITPNNELIEWILTKMQALLATLEAYKNVSLEEAVIEVENAIGLE